MCISIPNCSRFRKSHTVLLGMLLSCSSVHMHCPEHFSENTCFHQCRRAQYHMGKATMHGQLSIFESTHLSKFLLAVCVAVVCCCCIRILLAVHVSLWRNEVGINLCITCKRVNHRALCAACFVPFGWENGQKMLTHSVLAHTASGSPSGVWKCLEQILQLAICQSHDCESVPHAPCSASLHWYYNQYWPGHPHDAQHLKL